ncbi:hypothetical protein KR093_002987, partial [Drosophila rubida]
INTPVAKKTRSAARLKSCDEELQTKTPNASTSMRLLSETPRRSARKSVRPPKDYTDIIENNGMRSARKDNSNKMLTPIDAVGEAETVEDVTHKWSAVDVGRASRKRTRKAKRAASKKAKLQVELEGQAEDNDENQEEQEMSLKDATISEIVTDAKQSSVKKAATKFTGTEAEATAKAETVPEVENETSAVPVAELAIKSSTVPASEVTVTAAIETVKAVETVVEVEALNHSLDAPAMLVTAEDMNDLGLSPLTKQEELVKLDDDENEEMPSLILLDDEDPAEALNRTFEIDETEEEQSNELPQSPLMDLEMPKLQMSPEVPIKVVLTDENEAETTLLKASDTPKSTKLQAYKFPTPFKSKSKLNLKFGDIKNSNKKNILNSSTACRSRRSKSVCDLTQEQPKTVSFYSPIEVSTVSDIDKRWEGFNTSHVTKRRKRSKSLDTSIVKSKIPRPKFFGANKAPLPLPVKMKARTKLPNFAAIHQKHFSKMENLVDHIERKAVRAKELTSSAKKIISGTTASAQKSSAKKLPLNNTLAAVRVPPKAQKKIALSESLMTPMKNEEAERKRNLPTPRNIIVAQPQQAMTSSRLPLLTKPAVQKAKIVTSTAATNVATKPAVAASSIVQNKLEARRKRHMEMFKGRTTKENRSDLIRGVRSNRRFELQMEHRRQMNEN